MAHTKILIITSVNNIILETFKSINLHIQLDELTDNTNLIKHRMHLGTNAVVIDNNTCIEQESQMLHVDTIAYKMPVDINMQNVSTRFAFTDAISRLSDFTQRTTDWLYVSKEHLDTFRVPGALGTIDVNLKILQITMRRLVNAFETYEWNIYFRQCDEVTYCHTHMCTIPSTGCCASCSFGSPRYIERKSNLLLRSKRLSTEILESLPLNVQQITLPDIHINEQHVALAGCWAAAYQWAIIAFRLMKQLLNEESGFDKNCFNGYSVDELLLSSIQVCALLCDIKTVLENPTESCEQWMHKKALSLASQWDNIVIAAAPLCDKRGLDWIGNSPTLYRTLKGTDFGLFGCGPNNARPSMINTRKSTCNLLKHKVTWIAYNNTLIKNNVGAYTEQGLTDCENIINKIRNRIIFWITNENGLLIGMKTVKNRLLSFCSIGRCMALDPTINIGLASGGTASLSLKAGEFLAWEDNNIIEINKENQQLTEVKQIESSENLCKWLQDKFTEYRTLNTICKWRTRSKIEYFLVYRANDRFLLNGQHCCWKKILPQAITNARNVTYTCNLPIVLNANELRLKNIVETTDYNVSMPTLAANARKAVIKQSLHGTSMMLVHIIDEEQSDTNREISSINGWCIL